MSLLILKTNSMICSNDFARLGQMGSQVKIDVLGFFFPTPVIFWKSSRLYYGRLLFLQSLGLKIPFS